MKSVVVALRYKWVTARCSSRPNLKIHFRVLLPRQRPIAVEQHLIIRPVAEHRGRFRGIGIKSEVIGAETVAHGVGTVFAPVREARLLHKLGPAHGVAPGRHRSFASRNRLQPSEAIGHELQHAQTAFFGILRTVMR